MTNHWNNSQNSGKQDTQDYSFVIAIGYKLEPTKGRGSQETPGGFQIQNFQVTLLTSKCGNIHGVLPTREAHQTSGIFIGALLME